jgi:hypothetical protein
MATRINRKYIIISMILLLLLAVSGDVYSYRTKSSQRAGLQVNAEKGLRDNRYFFYFINSSITNLGSEEDRATFKEAVRRDMLAQLLYMKFLFYESYSEIRKSQQILIDLYRSTLIKDIEKTRTLLNGFATVVINSKSKDAGLYLKLGYRDMRVAEIYLGMGDNFRENLYSLRLYKYVHAIKTAKHGTRYAFLSFIASSEEGAEKGTGLLTGAFISMADAYRESVTGPDRRKLHFDRTDSRIAAIAPADKKDQYRLQFLDSHYGFKQKKSLFDEIWETTDSKQLDEYYKKEYGTAD